MIEVSYINIEQTQINLACSIDDFLLLLRKQALEQLNIQEAKINGFGLNIMELLKILKL